MGSVILLGLVAYSVQNWRAASDSSSSLSRGLGSIETLTQSSLHPESADGTVIVPKSPLLSRVKEHADPVPTSETGHAADDPLHLFDEL